MNRRRILQFLGLLLPFTLFFTTGGKTQTLIPHGVGTPSIEKTHAPRITHAYALNKGPYGAIWKIYIESEDTDADMDYVVVVVDQTGEGRYPSDRILINPQHRNHLKGFLQ